MTDKEYRELTRSRTEYEWGVEFVIDDEYEDIDYTLHFDSFAEAKQEAEEPREGYRYRHVIVLIRDQGSEDRGVTDRQWAYLQEDGTLPEEFDGGNRVPKRFHQEVAKA